MQVNRAKLGSALTVVVVTFAVAFGVFWALGKPEMSAGAVFVSNAALVIFYCVVRRWLPVGWGVRPLLFDLGLAVFLGVAFLCTEEFYTSRISGSVMRLLWIFSASLLLSAYFKRRFPQEDLEIDKS